MPPRLRWLRMLPAAIVVIAALFVAPTVTAAQQPLHGVVLDAQGNPVPDAEVFLSRRQQSVRTDQFGRFQLDTVRRGDYWVFVRKLGYGPVMQSISVPSREQVRTVDVTLHALPTELQAVTVTAASGYGTRVGSAPWLNNDVKAWGRLITRDRIERSRAPLLSSLLRQYIPNFPFDAHGAHVAMTGFGEDDPSSRNGGQPTVPMTYAVRPCVPAFSINGGYPQYGFDPDVLPIEAIEALEFFRSGVGTPLTLQLLIPIGSCGIVRIWLRDVAS